MTNQAQVSAFGVLLLFQSEREVNRLWTSCPYPKSPSSFKSLHLELGLEIRCSCSIDSTSGYWRRIYVCLLRALSTALRSAKVSLFTGNGKSRSCANNWSSCDATRVDLGFVSGIVCFGLSCRICGATGVPSWSSSSLRQLLSGIGKASSAIGAGSPELVVSDARELIWSFAT